MEYDERYAVEQLRRSRHPLRRVIKHFYLDNILSDVKGSTIDFGCGAGQLLARLPKGSVGLEVNPYLVKYLQAAKLNAMLYDANADQFRLSGLPENQFRTFVIAHVLEHFPDSAGTLRTLCQSCLRLGVDRIVAIVPGAKGFQSDATHRTFVTRSYLKQHELFKCGGYRIVRTGYFPINFEAVGKYFTFHEFKFVYERSG